MPRQARLDAPGTLHHVIIRGIEKRRIVDDKVDRDNFVSRMGQIAHETETVIYASVHVNQAVEEGLANPLRSLANLLTAALETTRNNVIHKSAL